MVEQKLKCQFSEKLRAKKLLVILRVFFLLLQFQPGTGLLNLLTNHTPQSNSVNLNNFKFFTDTVRIKNCLY